MYESFYGFREAPFELTSNPRFLFFTAQHREVLCNLEYGLSTAKPVTVLIGDAGTGKSTLLRAVLDSEVCRRVMCLLIDNPTLTRAEFIQMLMQSRPFARIRRRTRIAELQEARRA